MGINNEFIGNVNQMKWGKLFFMKFDVYKNLEYEVYSSLKLKTNIIDNILDCTISFGLYGEPHTITLEKPVEWLKCDYEGMLNAPWMFSQNGV